MPEQLSNVQEIGVNARCGCSVPKLCVGQHRRHAATSAAASDPPLRTARLRRSPTARHSRSDALPIRYNHFIYCDHNNTAQLLIQQKVRTFCLEVNICIMLRDKFDVVAPRSASDIYTD